MTRRLNMPPEWSRQSGTWLAWPHNSDTWPINLVEAQTEFVELARQIALNQPVFVVASNAALEEAKHQFSGSSGIHFVDLPTNDAWVRDYGPTFVIDVGTEKLLALDWKYNAWGGKYPPFDHDQAAAKKIASHLRIECITSDVCIEGGAIEVSDDIVLTTTSCLLDPNRNPNGTQPFFEDLFRDYLGKQTVWLSGDCIEGDDTDGHIDQLARFVDNKTILYAWTDDEDPQQVGLKRNLSDLKSGLGSIGRDEINLIPLNLPAPIYFDEQRIPASYCNFLITNQSVIVPQFDDPNDIAAIQTIADCFPERTVVGLPSKNLSVGLGSFHCLSQQQPVDFSTQL